MKTIAILLTAVGLAAGAVNAQNLLSNGDFLLGQNDPGDPTQPNTLNPVGWTEVISGGWSNRELNNNGTYGDANNYHYAMGNAGGYGNIAYQDVTVADNGSTFQLTADSALDAWWKNSGYIKLEFYNAGATTLLGQVESTHWGQPNYDVGVPWANYSVAGFAPAGTEVVRASLGTYGEGGTARFDNAVLATVVPEPGTAALVALGAATLFGYRSRRNTTRA